MRLLVKDLEITDSSRWTFISDKQKIQVLFILRFIFRTILTNILIFLS